MSADICVEDLDEENFCREAAFLLLLVMKLRWSTLAIFPSYSMLAPFFALDAFTFIQTKVVLSYICYVSYVLQSNDALFVISFGQNSFFFSTFLLPFLYFIFQTLSELLPPTSIAVGKFCRCTVWQCNVSIQIYFYCVLLWTVSWNWLR